MIAALFSNFYTAEARNRGSKSLLIINSYHEDELWANRMVQPIELYLATNDSVRSEKVYLNNSAITDEEAFQEMCDNIFERYANKHPNFVVLLGNFAFTLRDRIKEEWGDIPFLLISRIETFAPTNQYFAGPVGEDNFDINAQVPLGRIRNKYNFTAVIVPDYYDENIDLMMDLIPNMKDFVFMSDNSYVNKLVAMRLESSLLERYPGVNFQWIQASEADSDEMVNMLITPQKNIGLLLSSWVYEMQSTRGVSIFTTQDLVFVTEAVNPVFTMRQAYMSMGSVGGVFSNNDEITDHIVSMVNGMVHGANLKQIPFYVPEKPLTCVSYPLMKKYGLNLKALPKGTIIRNKPATYFERYGVLTIAIFICFVILIGLILWKNRIQSKQISVLKRHHNFINNMPMPYTKATLWLDGNDNVVNINYEVKNNAYDELISKNSMPDNPLHLFTNDYLTDVVKKMVETSMPVSLRYHFKRTNTYCYFIFVPLDAKANENKNKLRKKTDPNAPSKMDIDVFAVDITKDQELQKQLKDQAITLDISMEMSQLVPWQWNAVTDDISFYSYRKNITGTVTNERDGKIEAIMKFEDYVKNMPPEDADAMMKIYSKVLRGEISRFDFEYRYYRDENREEYDWCENHGVVTDTDSDGRPLRMSGSVQFITDRKMQEEQMSQTLVKAQESDMLKSAFLANMSHEIRTPLNAIVGFSNLLSTTEDIEERKEYAEIINHNNELLLSLINDILDLAKIESNTITLTYDLCDIHDVVDSISKTVSIRVPRDVKLNVVHYSDQCIVKADAAHVSQILINLLTNATKFTKRGSITVGYEVYEDDKKIYFYVKDTGIGLSKENADKIFNRFVKLNSFIQGSGLGLAICRTLVEKMGGEIGVESAGEGRGSTFWFTIPYDPMELKLHNDEVEQEEVVVRKAISNDNIMGEPAEKPAKIERMQSTPSVGFKTSKDISSSSLSTLPDDLVVLVAEDNQSNYWLLERLIGNKFKIIHAENGQLALDMLDEVKPDIIVMDINMPQLDGYGAVAEMRKRGIDVPIIAVTAYAFASDRVKILSSGFDAFVSKPVSATLFYDTIAEVWERKKLKKEKESEK